MQENQELNSQDVPQQYTFSLKIPKERIAVLIGKEGSDKKLLEEEMGVRLDIDSEEGDVEISTKDPVILFSAKDVIKAIGRGFNPRIALQLLKQDFAFEQIPLTEYVKNKNHILRVRGRVIGKEGKARETIEQLTETNISVYGKTICIIGRIDYVSMAKQAVISLVSGSPHSSVFKFLEKRRRDVREAEIADGHGF